MRVLLALLLIPLSSLAQVPTRFEDIVKDFEAQDRTNPPPKGALVIVGSSTIKRWYTSEADLAPLVTIRRGIVGAQTADIDYYLERVVLVYEPKAVLLYVGDNDLGSGKTAQHVLTNNAKIAKRIVTRFPKARVYFVSSKPSPLRWGDWDKYVLSNSLLKDHAATDPRYAYIDVASALLLNGVPYPPYYATDQLHLSAAGYVAWTGAIKPLLMAADRRPMAPTEVRVNP